MPLASEIQQDVADEVCDDPVKAETANEVLSLLRTLAKHVDKLSPEDAYAIVQDLDEPEREIIREKLRWL